MTLLPDPKSGSTGQGEQHRGSAAMQVQYGRVISFPHFKDCMKAGPPAWFVLLAGLKNQSLMNCGMVLKYGREGCLDQNAQFEFWTPSVQRLNEGQSQNRVAQRPQAYQENAGDFQEFAV